MLVVHPKDKTTSVPSALYEGTDANVISGNCSKKEMEHLLHHVSTQERIMLLGHGSDKGLYIIPNRSLENDKKLFSNDRH